MFRRSGSAWKMAIVFDSKIIPTSLCMCLQYERQGGEENTPQSKPLHDYPHRHVPHAHPSKLISFYGSTSSVDTEQSTLTTQSTDTLVFVPELSNQYRAVVKSHFPQTSGL